MQQSIRSGFDRSLDQSLMVDPMKYFFFQPVLHDWYNTDMCYPVCGIVHIKDPFTVRKEILYTSLVISEEYTKCFIIF